MNLNIPDCCCQDVCQEKSMIGYVITYIYFKFVWHNFGTFTTPVLTAVSEAQ